MNIGVDMDEILVNMMKGFFLYHNHSFGTQVDNNTPNYYNFEETFGYREEELKKKFLEFFETKYFEDLELIPGAAEGIRELSAKHRLALITARPSSLAKHTHKSLNRHFPSFFSSVHLTNQWLTGDNSIKKSYVCKKENISIMIDDNLGHALDCSSQGIKVLLLDYPWNQAENLPENIKRVFSWRQIVEEISKFDRFD